MNPSDLEQILTEAARHSPDESGLKTVSEATHDFLAHQDRTVPYLMYFLKSSAIIAVIFLMLLGGSLIQSHQPEFRPSQLEQLLLTTGFALGAQ